MAKRNTKNPWAFPSVFILLLYCLFQILRWRILPQSMDIYYHLLTAWGFIQAGGYSGWDFWQYAPYGRIHIYPPFFHIILAAFMQLGINKIILAKALEAIMPIAFLVVLWHFVRKNYSDRLAFFVILLLGSSFSFWRALSEYIPATLAMILGFLALGQLFQRKCIRSVILLGLCFYTHIGISWFFALGIILWGLLNREEQRLSLVVFISAVILSAPVLFKELVGLRFVSVWGIKQKYFCEFKITDYVLAFFGLGLILRQAKRYRLFLALFLASFVFLPYPYRFFSAQGYLPIILLAAVSLDCLCETLQDRGAYLRYVPALLAGSLVLVSPTILMEKNEATNTLGYKTNVFDSAFIDMLLPMHNKRTVSGAIWFPDEYLPAVDLIKHNSREDDIIYASIHNLGICLASIAERATANGLLAEIGAAQEIDPFQVSKIVVFTQDDNPDWVKHIAHKYNLVKLEENKLLILYVNPAIRAKAEIRKASVPFWAIGLAILASIILLGLRRGPFVKKYFFREATK